MELKASNKAKTAYEIALERVNRRTFSKQPETTVTSSERSSRDWKKHSVYDQSLFIDCDDEIPDNSPPVVDNDRRNLVEIPEETLDLEDLTPITFPELPESDPKDFEVMTHYTGPIVDYGGYAKMNRTYIFGLRDLGALVKVDKFPSIADVNQTTIDALEMMSHTNVPPNAPKIYGMTVPDLIAHGGRKILYTMMETSEKVHRDFSDRLNLADEIWTPSTWCKEVFENSGVIPPIKVMPLGVDMRHFKPGAEPINFKEPLRTFRFLAMSGWSYRKGFDILIRAFLEEFSNRDDVSLIISTRYAGQVSDRAMNKIREECALIRSMVKKTNGELPHIVLHSACLPESKMPNLFNSAHCFALISRGEGWGLPYCEAGACGLPIIASDHGGQRDFLDDEVAYMVPPTSYFRSNTTDPGDLKNMSWISHFYEGQLFPDYEGESFELTKHHLRNVYENYGEAQRKAKKFRQRLAQNFDWSVSVSKAYNRLKEICAGKI